jgi:hypothetical protein
MDYIIPRESCHPVVQKFPTVRYFSNGKQKKKIKFKHSKHPPHRAQYRLTDEFNYEISLQPTTVNS